MPLTKVATALIAFIPALHAASTHSVSCKSGSIKPKCSVVEGDLADADATGRYYEEIEETGWSRLFVQSKSVTPSTAYAAGYLEGALTASRVVQHVNNFKVTAGANPMSAGVRAFAEATDKWTRAQIAANTDDAYWKKVGFLYDQMDGIVQAVNDHVAAEKRLTYEDELVLKLNADLPDIRQAVDASKRANYSNMSPIELAEWQEAHGHCSALIKLTPDGRELFAGHNTWWDYSVMLRVFKRYEFGGMPTVAMPSYPGFLASVDDFYQVDDMVVIETTIGISNNDLFERVVPQSLAYGFRAMVANYMAKTGPEWMEVFKKYNSGTYSNMWMVVDYSKFTPGASLPKGLLTVGEQLPGYFYYEDQTHVLSYGYWPSYNVAMYPETARLVGLDKIVEQHGPSFSYQETARGQVFRRDQGGVWTEEDMQYIMRYNRFQTDPLAHGDPCNQLACRGDLRNSSKAKAFGAVDAKYTSYAHVRAKEIVAISGPTYVDQEVFDWSRSSTKLQATPHEGQPDRFEFGWYVMGPKVDALPSPWHKTVLDKSGGYFIAQAFAPVCAIVTLVVLAVVGRSVSAYRKRTKKSGEHGSMYEKLEAPPGWAQSPGELPTASTRIGNMWSPWGQSSISSRDWASPASQK